MFEKLSGGGAHYAAAIVSECVRRRSQGGDPWAAIPGSGGGDRVGGVTKKKETFWRVSLTNKKTPLYCLSIPALSGLTNREEMKHSKENQRLAIDTLPLIAEKIETGGLLIVSIKRTSQSNMNWAAELRVAYAGSSGRIETLWITWAVAVLTESSLNKRDELRWNSLGTERGFEMAKVLERLFETHLGRVVGVRNFLTIA